jgi:hypothetical protein
MAVLTDDALGDLLAAMLKKASRTDLYAEQSYWQQIVPAANADAQTMITAKWLGDGYTFAVLQTWDGYASFQRRLGLWQCGVYGRALISKDDSALLEKLDCRQELEDLEVLTVNGIPVIPDPATEAPSRPQGGVLTTDACRPRNPLLYDPRYPGVNRPRLNP